MSKSLQPSSLPTTTMAINFQEISQSASSELRRVAQWIESRTAQETENIKQKNDEKTGGDEVRLLANFPESKPFWEDSSHKLECFACEFSQETGDDGGDPTEKVNWMTKRIRKNNKTHIVAFCPQCTAGDPWIIHGEADYTMMRIDPTVSGNGMLTQQKKLRKSEGWIGRPKKVPYYKDGWSLGDLYDKPSDWHEQSEQYDRKVKRYEKEKEDYDRFCAQKLQEIPILRDPRRRKVPRVCFKTLPQSSCIRGIHQEPGRQETEAHRGTRRRTCVHQPAPQEQREHQKLNKKIYNH